MPRGTGGGARAGIERARQALLPLASALAAGEPPAFAAAATAAARVGTALDRMEDGLAGRDPQFFVALRDGSRALVELRTVARRMAIGGAVGGSGLDGESAARLAELTSAWRELRRQDGAEELRHQAGVPLQPAEGGQLARLAAVAREWSARVRQVETAAGAARQLAEKAGRARRASLQPRGGAGRPPALPVTMAPSSFGPAGSDPVLLAELRQLAALLDRIAAAPRTLEGYLNALIRTDAALGTWSGELAYLAALGQLAPAPAGSAAGAPESGTGGWGSGSPGEQANGGGNSGESSAADASAMDAGGGALDALAPAGEELASGAGAGFVFAADLESGHTWTYLKEGGAATGTAGARAGGSELDPFDEYDEGSPPLEAGSRAAPPGEATALAGTGEAQLVAADGMAPAAAETEDQAAGLQGSEGSPPPWPSGEDLARRFAGTYADGRVVIHGNAGDLPEGGVDEAAWADPRGAADPLLDWLAGAPPLCSTVPPRCGPRE